MRKKLNKKCDYRYDDSNQRFNVRRSVCVLLVDGFAFTVCVDNYSIGPWMESRHWSAIFIAKLHRFFVKFYQFLAIRLNYHCSRFTFPSVIGRQIKHDLIRHRNRIVLIMSRYCEVVSVTWDEMHVIFHHLLCRRLHVVALLLRIRECHIKIGKTTRQFIQEPLQAVRIPKLQCTQALPVSALNVIHC